MTLVGGKGEVPASVVLLAASPNNLEENFSLSGLCVCLTLPIQEELLVLTQASFAVGIVCQSEWCSTILGCVEDRGLTGVGVGCVCLLVV